MPGTKAAEAVRREQILAAAYALASTGGLRAVTVRDVALHAEVSPGLVLFHFGSKDELVLGLLDWLLVTTTALRVDPGIAAIPTPLERLRALLREEMARLSSEPARIRLFFEFWSVGIWHVEIGRRMQRELDRYREAFRPMAAEVIAADPRRFGTVTAAGLAAVIVSFIKGCAVQSMVEPNLDIDEFLAAAESLLILRASAARPVPRSAS
jgi:TetR/AcrR family transcriptional regulator, transcriptional repressor of bet genes